MGRNMVRWSAALAAGVALAAAGASGAGAAGTAAARISRPACVPGAQLWLSRYTGPGNKGDRAAAETVSPGGGSVFVTGTSSQLPSGVGLGAGAIATVAYRAATGAVLWISRYNGPGNSLDTAAAMAPSPAGNRVFVAGSTTVSQGGVTSWVTVADNAVTGARLWAERYGNPGPGSGPTAVAVGPGGRTVFVTGAITEPDGSDSFATVAYRSATGARLWASRYAIPGSTVPASVTVGPGGGRVYVTGSTNGDYLTVAYDTATGARLWASRYPGLIGRAAGGAVSVAAGPGGGRVYVTGTSSGASGGLSDYATVAYDSATGARLWAEHYSSAPGPFQSRGAAVAVSPGGGKVLVTGGSDGDFATVAYDSATGAELWASRYPNPGTDGSFASAVAVSPDGDSVLITGTSFRPGGRIADFVTVAYSAATGAQQWASRYDGPGQGGGGGPAGVRASASAAFVTGTDFVTIAYCG
jgi:outer membrane protein assembly factor BamB